MFARIRESSPVIAKLALPGVTARELQQLLLLARPVPFVKAAEGIEREMSDWLLTPLATCFKFSNCMPTWKSSTCSA